MAMEEDFIEEESEDKEPDRPLECGDCKKPIAIRYTEAEKGKIVETSMCSDCPHFQKKLKGGSITSAGVGPKAGLVCGDCRTSLEDLQVGHPLGCSHCYEVFTEAILIELNSRNKIPLKVNTGKKNATYHLGRILGESVEVNPSLQLVALNEALNEMLKKEEYEQAALIRDQINAIAKESQKKNEKKNDKRSQ